MGKRSSEAVLTSQFLKSNSLDRLVSHHRTKIPLNRIWAPPNPPTSTTQQCRSSANWIQACLSKAKRPHSCLNAQKRATSAQPSLVHSISHNCAATFTSANPLKNRRNPQNCRANKYTILTLRHTTGTLSRLITHSRVVGSYPNYWTKYPRKILFR